MKLLSFALLAGALVPFAQRGVAAPVYLQYPPNGNGFDITDFRLADDFKLAGGSVVNGLGLWYLAQHQTDLSVVTYAIYADNGGALGALLQSQTINNPTTSFDSTTGLFVASFAITPLSLLGATEYWLELHAGSSLTNTSGFTISWGAVNNNATLRALSNQSSPPGTPNTPINTSGFEQYAFDVNGFAVPESGTAALGALGGCVLVFLASRRKVSY